LFVKFKGGLIMFTIGLFPEVETQAVGRGFGPPPPSCARMDPGVGDSLPDVAEPETEATTALPNLP
jgi:hypothetical protein